MHADDLTLPSPGSDDQLQARLRRSVPREGVHRHSVSADIDTDEEILTYDEAAQLLKVSARSRFRIVPESFDRDQPIHVLNYGRSRHVYRVFFTIDERAKLVRVLHIRRGARERPSL